MFIGELKIFCTLFVDGDILGFFLKEWSPLLAGNKLLWLIPQLFRLRLYNNINNFHRRLSMMSHTPTQPHQLPSEDSYSPSPQGQRQKIDSSSLKELAKAKERFNNFVKTLGHLKDTNILQSIADSCHFGQRKIKKIYTQIKYGFIITALETRIQKMWRTRKIKKNWGEDDITILIWIVSKLCELHSITTPEHSFTPKQWAFVSSLIPGTTPSTCLFRWLNLKTINLANRHWTLKQQQILKQIVDEHLCHCPSIKDWKAVSQQLYNRNQSEDRCYRNAKQCKEHWSCYLSPSLKKGPWILQQDLTLLANISHNKGSKRWCELVNQLPGRTENAIKNRFTLLIQKQRKLHKYRYMSELELIQSILQKNKDIFNSQESFSEQVILAEKKDEVITDSYHNSIKEQVSISRMDFQQFRVSNLNYCLLEPGIMNASYQFMKLEEICKDKAASSDKLRDENMVGEYCFVQSLSIIFDHCFS